jgi:hypothetical protein
MKSKIKEKKDYLLHWMYDFIEDDDEPAYLPQHVEECDQLLTSFIDEVANNANKSDYSWLTSRIEQLIKQLNELNFKLDHQLIESDQRDDISDLLKLVVEDAGHHYKEDLSANLQVW